MSYKVKKEKHNYNILEKNTDITIVLKTTEQRAKDFCRKLNLGAGFNGFTPLFFANFKGLEPN